VKATKGPARKAGLHSPPYVRYVVYMTTQTPEYLARTDYEQVAPRLETR
jgi:hypothetical protein